MLYPTKALKDFLGGLGYGFKREDRRHKLFHNPKTGRRAVVPQRDTWTRKLSPTFSAKPERPLKRCDSFWNPISHPRLLSSNGR